jgi:hypothetical protein
MRNDADTPSGRWVALAGCRTRESRAQTHGFAVVDPDRDLGHSDRKQRDE